MGRGRRANNRWREVWLRHSQEISLALAAAVLVLAVVVAVQGAALLDRGWTLAFGTIPDYIAAFGTAGALLVAILLLRHEIDARRADEAEKREADAAAISAQLAARADQARLVILEFEYDHDLDEFTHGRESFMAATVRNLSNRPIFDVMIEVPSGNAQIRLGTVDDSATSPGAAAIDRHDKHVASYEHIAPEVDWDWLKTAPVVYFSDVNGLRWSRKMAGQPTEVTQHDAMADHQGQQCNSRLPATPSQSSTAGSETTDDV